MEGPEISETDAGSKYKTYNVTIKNIEGLDHDVNSLDLGEGKMGSWNDGNSLDSSEGKAGN